MLSPSIHFYGSKMLFLMIVGDFLLLADVIQLLRNKRLKIVYFQMQFHTFDGKFTRLYPPGSEKRRQEQR